MDTELLLIAILPALTAISAVLGIFAGIRKQKIDKKMSSLKADIIDNSVELKASLGEEKYKILKLLLQDVDDDTEVTDKAKRKSGHITKYFLIYIVPGVVALALVGLYIYLRATNAANPDFIMPDDLTSTMTVVMGYLFGAGAASV